MTLTQGSPLDFYQLEGREMDEIREENMGNNEDKLLHIHAQVREARRRVRQELLDGIYIVKDTWTDPNGTVHRILRYTGHDEAMRRSAERIK